MKIEIIIDDRLVAGCRRAAGLLTKRQVGYVAAVGLLLGTVTLADAAVKPHTFVAGQPATAADVNENFDVLYDAVTANEDTLGAIRTSSFYAHSMGLGRGDTHHDDAEDDHGAPADSFNGYIYWGSATTRAWGQVGVNIPVGAVMTDFTCYFYNNSAVPENTSEDEETYLSGSIRRTNLTTGDATGVATIREWPTQSDAIQEYSMDVGDDGLIEPGYQYFVHMEMSPGLADTSEVYAGGADEAQRMLRHYGCRIDYELP